MLNESSPVQFGTPTVVIGNGAHPAEFWAERLSSKIISVGNLSPEPIRIQAQAFQDQIKQVALLYIRQAMASAVAAERLKLGG